MKLFQKYPLQVLSVCAVVISCVAAFALYPDATVSAQQVKSLEAEKSSSIPGISVAESSVVEEVQSANNKSSQDDKITQENDTWNGAEFAPSLAGTDIDGDLRQDDQGHLIVDLAVKDLFDYFLSTVGEVPLERAVGQISNLADQKLSAAAAGEVSALLDNYLAYQHALQDMMDVPLLAEKRNDYEYYSEVMAQTFVQVKQLRRTFFAPEVAEAFFALEEQYSEYAVAAMKIRAETDLSEAEKQKKIVALEAKMPEQMRTAQDEARLTAEIANTAREMFDRGHDKEDITSLLSDRYDAETVSEMMAFYEREKAWQSRLDEFLNMKSTINQMELNEEQKHIQLQELREQYFSQEEMVRVLSHEAIIRKQNKHQG